MHLKKLEDLNQCASTIVVPQGRILMHCRGLNLRYYDLTQLSLSAAIAQSKGGECSEAAAIAPPMSSERVDLTDSLGKYLEYLTLIPGAKVGAKTASVEFAMATDEHRWDGHPKCD